MCSQGCGCVSPIKEHFPSLSIWNMIKYEWLHQSPECFGGPGETDVVTTCLPEFTARCELILHGDSFPHRCACRNQGDRYSYLSGALTLPPVMHTLTKHDWRSALTTRTVSGKGSPQLILSWTKVSTIEFAATSLTRYPGCSDWFPPAWPGSWNAA